MKFFMRESLHRSLTAIRAEGVRFREQNERNSIILLVSLVEGSPVPAIRSRDPFPP
jgi:hypothetical protein